ncbi:MAG: hypothetical protein WCK37_01290 [Candidatus Falkowbacteria bacterium]
MTKKLKSLMSGEKNVSKFIFGVLMLVVFSLVFGPKLYAQFARQTGAEGWGYGYGYGYGYGGGFDGGTIAGRRTAGNPDPTVYEYNYGYGNIASGVTYDSTNGYTVSPAQMSSLVQSGVMIPNGNNIASTTKVSFDQKVSLDVNSNISVTIPAGTSLTAASAGDFSALAASDSISTSDLTNVGVVGSMSFGLPNLGLTVSPAITIAINLGTSYNGRTFTVYRKDAGGSWADSGTTCLVASGICSFTTTHLSSFAAGTASSGGGGGNNGGGNGGNAIPTTVTPTSSEEVVTTGVEPVLISENVGDNSAFITMEKSLVKKISAALSARLSGRILLQVESKGEAWYVNPLNKMKYFLGRPADAFTIMRKLGLGISNKDFAGLAKNKTLLNKLKGRIILTVQSRGEAYYINPVTLKITSLGRPADAFAIMRGVGLGVTNANLRQIGVSEAK